MPTYVVLTRLTPEAVKMPGGSSSAWNVPSPITSARTVRR